MDFFKKKTIAALMWFSGWGGSTTISFRENVISWWDFNGSGEDKATGNNNLSINGGITFPAGKLELCASFNGSTGVFYAADNSNLSFGNGTVDSPFSFTTWLSPHTTPAANDFFMAKRDATFFEYQAVVTSARKIAVILGSGGGATNYIFKTGNTVLTLDAWYQVTVTYSGGGYAGLKIYINGVEETYTNNSVGTYVAMSNTSATLGIGAYSGLVSTNFFDGRLDEMAFISKELSQEEVLELYNNGGGVEYLNS